MPLRLSSPTVGGSRPLLRALSNGKLSDGKAGVLIPMKLSWASLATPSFSSASVRMIDALSIQAGIQPAQSSRWQVV